MGEAILIKGAPLAKAVRELGYAGPVYLDDLHKLIAP